MIDDGMVHLNSQRNLALKKSDPRKEISVTESWKRALYIKYQINQQGIFSKKDNKSKITRILET